MNLQIKKMSTLIIDLETTGFNSLVDDIIEIAYCIVDSQGLSIHEWSSLVKTERIIKNSFIHGITNIMCASSGISLSRVIEIFRDDTTRFDVVKIMSYNWSFDGKFLIAKGIITNQEIQTGCLMREISTLLKSSKFLKLKDAFKCCTGIEFQQSHRAMSDVNAALEIYYHLYPKNSSYPEELVSPIILH